MPTNLEQAPSHDARAASSRLEVLDGWRAFSIVFVLASHMLPLGPKSLELNVSSGCIGMALFFCLSGFLIVSQLHANHDVISFYIRRLFRIVPLTALVVLAITLLTASPWRSAAVNLAFVENYVWTGMLPHLGHLWSLCIEMHFYLGIGLLMVLTRFRGFVLLFPLWLLLTFVRLWLQPFGTIETHLRIDEILAGANLALVHLGYAPEWVSRALRRIPIGAWMVLLVVTSLTFIKIPIQPLRALAASSLIGATLLRRDEPRFAVLRSRPLRYLAEVSFAIYVLHPLTMIGWLGTGPTPAIKYARRVICFALTFAAAHLSTFYFEHRFQAWGRTLSKRFGTRRVPIPSPAQ